MIHHKIVIKSVHHLCAVAESRGGDSLRYGGYVLTIYNFIFLYSIFILFTSCPFPWHAQREPNLIVKPRLNNS